MASLVSRRLMADDSGLSLAVGVGVHSLLLSLIGRTLKIHKQEAHHKRQYRESKYRRGAPGLGNSPPQYYEDDIFNYYLVQSFLMPS